ncbi:RNA polymerase sigma factor [Gemmatimonas sp.]|uniref:RNA polymerase sigma factor n=1 Tax=Gemmatimonas sp. TaxID=1962908 RepID=UPI00286DAF27|nr:RNA polymerase sigma factor [Gemmatimonas sp.]
MAHDALPIPNKSTARAPHVGGEPVDDSESVAPVNGGAIDRVLLRFGGLMRRAAQARGLREYDVDEVLQDIRIRLWKTRASDENLDALGASYLHKVAMSAVIDFLRRRTARREDTLDTVLASETLPASLQVAPVDSSASTELSHRLEAALGGIVQNRRLVVQLHLEGYERQEIAGMTGWSEAKVRNLLYRGLDDLRAALRADGEQTP